MSGLPDESIDMVMTSPPYWALRDYKVDGQIGLEENPRVYIRRLVEAARGIGRILKPQGSFYLNLGDTYCSGKGSARNPGGGQKSIRQPGFRSLAAGANPNRMLEIEGAWLRPKQMLMIPARVAIALQDDGWILRNDVIWHKPNGLPHSVKDRLTNKHEHIFHFVKSREYFYDLDAIRLLPKTVRTKASGPDNGASAELLSYQGQVLQEYGRRYRAFSRLGQVQGGWRRGRLNLNNARARAAGFSIIDGMSLAPAVKSQLRAWWHDHRCHSRGVNPGDVWSIPTRPSPVNHTAAYPPDLCSRPIASSCPMRVCMSCGKPEGWRRTRDSSCKCDVGFRPGIVFDPFAGTGTTLVVAKKHGRRFLGCDLNQRFVSISNRWLASTKRVMG